MMMGAAFLVLLLPAPQERQDRLEGVVVSKQRRASYLSLVSLLHEAEEILPQDPSACIEKTTEVIESRSVEDAHKEVRLRIEHARGGWSDWILFLPYQVRGRARLARAESLAATSRPAAVDLAAKAIEDLKKSASQGAISSDGYREKAEALVARLGGASSTAKSDVPPASTPPAASPESSATIDQLLEQIKSLKNEVERLKGKVDRLNPEPPKSENPPPKDKPDKKE